MNIVQRIKDILLTPKQTWPVIASEASDLPTLYTQYIMILALIPALAGFIGTSIIGSNAFSYSVHTPLFHGLLSMVIGYLASLAMIYVLALIVDALAPTFGGQKNPLNASKLIAYGSTAGMVGGVFSLIPALSILGMAASLYSIYLLYLGLPVLMKTPQDKTLPYLIVTLACGLIAGAVIGGLSSLVV